MHAKTLHGQAAHTGVRHLAPALLAIMTGMLLVLATGFAPTPAIHNAAHDARHTAAFPCH